MGAWTLKLDHFDLLSLLHLRRPAKPALAAVLPAATKQPVDREVSRRRSEAMRGFFPKLAAWYERRSYEAEMREVDRYLSQATNIFDLEQRIRHLERQRSTGLWN